MVGGRVSNCGIRRREMDFGGRGAGTSASTRPTRVGTPAPGLPNPRPQLHARIGIAVFPSRRHNALIGRPSSIIRAVGVCRCSLALWRHLAVRSSHVEASQRKQSLQNANKTMTLIITPFPSNTIDPQQVPKPVSTCRWSRRPFAIYQALGQGKALNIEAILDRLMGIYRLPSMQGRRASFSICLA
jgi:hypothetical protein